MVRSLIPWTERVPKPLARLEAEMESLFERFFRPEEGWWGVTPRFMPRTDVAESDVAYEVMVELPGMKPEDFHVEVRDGSLWISGEKKEEEEEKGKTFHRVERRCGEFQRVIPLGGHIDEKAIEATYKEGVLKITVPKTEEAKTKRIEVKS